MLLFFVLAGGPPPGVNEAHYLSKAKHYWNPAWCPGDFFLNTADAHLVFYWTFGWLTRFLSLPATAWVGRAATWVLLAWSWRRLSVAVVPERLVSLVSGGLFLALLHRANMGGEWIVGGLEAKGFAYALVLLALESLVGGKWPRVWLLLGAASAFHVLVGGWSAVAALVAWRWARSEKPPLASLLPSLAGGFLLALPGLVPALQLTHGADPDIVREANRIYVFERFSHHLAFHTFPGDRMACHGALLLAWLVMLRVAGACPGGGRLHAFVGGAVLIAVAGAVLDVGALLDPLWAAGLLRYYWFRLSDAMLPLGAALVFTHWVLGPARPRGAIRGGALAVAMLLVAAHVGLVAAEYWRDGRPGAVAQTRPMDATNRRVLERRFLAWQAICRWIATETEPDATFITPRFQQTFKWYAGRGEVVNWKDTPQDAEGIVQWRRRMEEVYPYEVVMNGLVAHGEEGLVRLANKYGARYILLGRMPSTRPLSLERAYPPVWDPKSPYEVYRVPAGRRGSSASAARGARQGEGG